MLVTPPEAPPDPWSADALLVTPPKEENLGGDAIILSDLSMRNIFAGGEELLLGLWACVGGVVENWTGVVELQLGGGVCISACLMISSPEDEERWGVLELEELVVVGVAETGGSGSNLLISSNSSSEE